MPIESPANLVIGQLAGVFGVKGWVKIRSFTQPEENILDYGPWRLRTSSGIRAVEVDKAELPELPDGEYYWHQLIGLKVIANAAGAELLLGRIADMMETGANDVMVVRPIEGSIDDRERLIPYVPEMYVVGVDLDTSEVRVDWDPEF